MKKGVIGLFILMMMPLLAVAQSPLDQLAKIQADENYIWGEGRNTTDSKANQGALNDLISKISITVQSETNLDMQQVNDGDKIDSKTAMEAVIKTYAAGSLNNCRTIWITHEQRQLRLGMEGWFTKWCQPACLSQPVRYSFIGYNS